MKICSNCRHCNDNNLYNSIMGLSILGFPFHSFPFHERECSNINSPKFADEVNADDTCEKFEL